MKKKPTILLKKILAILTLLILPYNLALAQDAGPDQIICTQNTYLNAVPAEGGYWTNPGMGIATVVNPTLYNSEVTGIETMYETYTFTWHVGASTDGVDISNKSVYTDAGDYDGQYCESTPIYASTPMPDETGFWEAINTTATFENKTLSNTTVYLAPEGNQLKWTVTNGHCSNEDIALVFSNLVVVEAGPDEETCANSYLLQGNATEHSGKWEFVSGGGVIVNQSMHNSEINALGMGEIELEWTIDNLACISRDTVIITNNSVSAYAGEDQAVCDSSASIAAGTPMPGTFGDWLPVNTAIYFDDHTSHVTMVRSLDYGINQLEWVVTQGGCVARDTVEVTNNVFFADAGDDDQTCNNMYILQGNEPPISGKWEFVSGGGVLVNQSMYNSEINALGVGEIELEWSIDNLGCVTRDTVIITNNSVSAYAGEDQAVCDSSASIAAGTLMPGTFGSWFPIDAEVYFDDHTSHITTVRSLDYGINKLGWVVTQGVCEETDTIEITNNMFFADAGDDTEICENSFILQGNIPPISGKWQLLNGGGIIVDQSMYNSEINALGVGEIELEWSIDNLGCVSRDTVFITNNLVEALAGIDQIVCDSSAAITANTPPEGAFGDWLPVNTTVYFDNHSSNNTMVRSLDIGDNELEWSIINKGCESRDTVIVTYISLFADAGADIAFYSDNYPERTETVNLNAGIPAEGFGQWSVIQGLAKINNSLLNNAVVNELDHGENIFRWTVSNEYCSVFDDVSVISGYSFKPETGVTDMDWANPDDWDNGVVPSVGDSVTIVDVEAILQGDTAYCHALYVSSGSEFNISGDGALFTDGMTLSKNNKKFAGVDGEAHIVIAGDGAVLIGYGNNQKSTSGSSSDGLRIGSGGSVIIEQDAEKSTGDGGSLRVKGGSIIIEQDAEKADGAGGTMRIRGSVIIEQDAEKSTRLKGASSGNNLVVRSGGSVIIEQDAEKSTTSGGSLRVKGGSIIIEQDAEKSTTSGGTLHVRSGSVIIEQDAEKTSQLKSSYSGSLIVRGGSVIIEQDAEKSDYKTEIIVASTEVYGGQIIIGKLSNAKVTGSGFRTGSIIIEQDAEKSTDVDTSLIVKTGGSLLFDASLNTGYDYCLKLGANTYTTFENGSTIDLDVTETGNPKPILIGQNASLLDLNENSELAAKFEHLFTLNKAELFSVPFANQNSEIFTVDAKIKTWSEANYEMDDLTNAQTFNYMQGFSIIYPAADYLSITEGILNTGTLSLGLEYTDGISIDQNGWNLCGNPYPSAIDWELQTELGNISSTIYQYDDISKQYKLYQKGGLALNGGSQYVKPGQGFFVRASGSGASLSLNNDMRLHYAVDGSSTKETPSDFLRLKVEGNSYSDETIIRFVNGATNGYDEGTDAYKLLSPVTDAPQLFSLMGSEKSKTAINSLPTHEPIGATVQLCFKAGVDGTYKITASELNFESSVDVILKDLNDNTTYNLKTTSEYSFNYTTSDAEERFELKFGDGAVGVNNLDNNKLKLDIYAFGDNVYIKTFDDKNYKYELYNINGKLIKSNNLTKKGLNAINVANLPGIYIVKVISGNKIYQKSVSLVK